MKVMLAATTVAHSSRTGTVRPGRWSTDSRKHRQRIPSGARTAGPSAKNFRTLR
jgi:hypothetical protein